MEIRRMLISYGKHTLSLYKLSISIYGTVGDKGLLSMKTRDGRHVPKFWETGYDTWEGTDDEFFIRINIINKQMKEYTENRKRDEELKRMDI